MTSKGFFTVFGFFSAALLLSTLPWLFFSPSNDSSAHPLPEKVDHFEIVPVGEDDPIWLMALNDPVTCSVNVTTTDSNPLTNHNLGGAATIANYELQSLLVRNVNYTDFGSGSVDVQTRSDFYRIDNTLVNFHYSLSAIPKLSNNYDLGIIIYNRLPRAIYTDTNTSDHRADISFEAFNDGPYYIEIFQLSEQCTGQYYTLSYNKPASPTPTATPTRTPSPVLQTSTPAPTWPGGFDQYEPNYDFNHATTIAPGLTYNLNFMPWGGWSIDNDYFKIRVKPGLFLSCETSDLDAGVDPNMIFYSAPNDGSAFASNDDIELGNFNSRISYFSTFEGFVYVLLGQGDRMSAGDAANSDYKLKCELTVPGTTPDDSTPVPDKDNTPVPTPTQSPTTPASPIATPTLVPTNVDLTIRQLSTPEAVSPTATPTGFRSFRVLVYYDSNQDAQQGAGEGVAGFFVRVLSTQSSEELARGYTDEQGQSSFTVSTVGSVRVIVPLLGVDQIIGADKPEVNIRIVPPTLPETIP